MHLCGEGASGALEEGCEHIRAAPAAARHVQSAQRWLPLTPACRLSAQVPNEAKRTGRPSLSTAHQAEATTTTTNSKASKGADASSFENEDMGARCGPAT